MEIANSFIYQNQTNKAFEKLLGTDFNGKTAYNIKKIYEAMWKQRKLMGPICDEALKLYCELDEKGNIVEPDGPGSFKIKDGQMEGWQAKYKELMDQKFVIEKVHKIPLKDILENTNLKLSSVDLTLLEPVLDGLDYSL